MRPLYRFFWGLGSGLCALLFRLRVEGRMHIPTEGGLIVASNHCSYVDPILIGVASYRELCYVAKREVFPIPVLGWLITRLNAIPIDRSARGDRQALRRIEEAVGLGGALLMFPEGTRNKAGRFLKPRSGIGMMVVRNSVPVVPVYLSGTVNVWRTLLGLERAVVRFGPPLRFDRGEEDDRKGAYRRIGAGVMAAIDALSRASSKQAAVPPDGSSVLDPDRYSEMKEEVPDV